MVRSYTGKDEPIIHIAGGSTDRHLSTTVKVFKMWFFPPTLLVGKQIGAATMENSMEVPQKTKNKIAI